jgi:hypothetical protein
MRKIVVIMCCLFISLNAFSQWRIVEKLERDKSPNLKIGYLSRINFNNPGVNVGLELMLVRKKVSIFKFQRTNERYLNFNVTYFNEPDLNDCMAISAEFLQRSLYYSTGFFTEASIGFGVGRGINYVSPPTYVKSPDGIETTKSPSVNFIIATITAGLGYDFNVKQNKPFKVYGRAGIYPLNGAGGHGNLFLKSEFGVITSLRTFKKKS